MPALLHVAQLPPPPRYIQYPISHDPFGVWLTARTQGTIGLKVPVEGDDLGASGVQILDKLTLGAVGYWCFGGRGMALPRYALGEFAGAGPRLVVAVIEHLAQLARADFAPRGNGGHDGTRCGA